MNEKFYILNDNKNNAIVVSGSEEIALEGAKLQELVSRSVEAATEKHIPVVSVNNNKVSVVVGEVEHPMVEEHFIEWILLKTKEGIQLKKLEVGQRPAAEFALSEGDEVVEAYAYCNLHGLWDKAVK